MNILITCATKPLALRVAKQLSEKHNTTLASSEDFPTIMASKFNKIPTGKNPTFAHEILKLCLDKSVDYLLPLDDTEFYALNESKILLLEYGVKVLLPSNFHATPMIKNPNKAMDLILIIDGHNFYSTDNADIVEDGLYAIHEGRQHLVIA